MLEDDKITTNTELHMKDSKNKNYSSRIPGFAKLNFKERVEVLLDRGILSQNDIHTLKKSGALPKVLSESLIENSIGTFELPLGIATNFVIDNEPILIPMAIEESSVVAAASYGAKLALNLGGFKTKSPKSIATAQILFEPHDKNTNFASLFDGNMKDDLMAKARESIPRLLKRGGDVEDIELRNLGDNLYVFHIHVNTCEAMGANLVNTIAEHLGSYLPKVFPCQVDCKILTNLTLKRLAHARCEIPFDALKRNDLDGYETASRIVKVCRFADKDPFRAATHNKGVMNGIDAVVIATGNDWRAVESGCHAYASYTGSYKPLTRWSIESKKLIGEITCPIAVGTVGGVTKLHPMASTSLRILGNPSSSRLSAIIASVGLAQNLSAIRALACEGIQKGHMALHEKNLEMLKTYDHMPDISIVSSKKGN